MQNIVGGGGGGVKKSADYADECKEAVNSHRTDQFL